MKIVKQKNGITLIALVITIILMLILSASVINLALHDSSLFNYSKRANDEQAKAAAAEKIDELITWAKYKTDKNPDNFAEVLLTELNNDETLESHYNSFTTSADAPNSVIATAHSGDTYVINSEGIEQVTLVTLNIRNGAIQLYSDKWVQNGETHMVSNAKYTITGTASSGRNKQIIIKEAGTYDITLENLTILAEAIPLNSPAFIASGDVNNCFVTIKIKGNNTITGNGGAAIYFGFARNVWGTSTLKITSAEGDGNISGNLIANGGTNAAGIGGSWWNVGDNRSSANITIAGRNNNCNRW